MNRETTLNIARLAAYLAAQLTQQNGFSATGDFAYWSHGISTGAAKDALALHKLGNKARKLAEENCNGTLPELRYARLDGEILREATTILSPYKGLKASSGGDPRGYVFHIHGLPGNTLGGDEHGYGI